MPMTKKMERMRKKTRPPMETTMPPPRRRKARQGVRAAELRVSPDAGKCDKGRKMTVHTMRTTMLPPRSRKARQEVRAAELRVSPDAGKCGKGQAQQTTRCGNAGTVAEPFHQYYGDTVQAEVVTSLLTKTSVVQSQERAFQDALHYGTT